MDCVLECAYMCSIPTPLNPNPVPTVSSSPVQIDLRYLAEGGANIVYTISMPESAREYHPLLDNRLLRLRKNIPSAVPCAQTVSNFITRIAPLFPPQNLIEQIVFELPEDGIIKRLNQALIDREKAGTRPTKRHGVYLTSQEEEANGVLVTDMTPNVEAGETLIEFKPKWLVQSPSAPKPAKRCRNCALKEMRRAQGIPRGKGDAGFCPLDLLSTEEETLREIFQAIEIEHADAAKFLLLWKEKVSPLLLRLRDAQVEHNNVGLWDFYPRDLKDFSIAMTLRDCSVFINIRKDMTEEMTVDVRLGDLDLKTSAGGKFAQWAETERRLVREGWYEGTEENEDSRGMGFCRGLSP